MSTIRSRLRPLEGNESNHLGLRWDRYVSIKASGNDEAYAAALASLSMAPPPPIYRLAFGGWLESQRMTGGACTATFACIDRMAVSLGKATIHEINLALHHTYGVPYIPGSALKGLVAHFAADASSGVPADTYAMLFGTAKAASSFTFHDAWLKPTDTAAVRRDVMTAHHPDYYMGAAGHRSPPTDFDDPRPVAFMATRGEFVIAIATSDRSDAMRGWLNYAMDLAAAALESWGIGAKTSSGYGRMSEVPATRWLPPVEGQIQAPPARSLSEAAERLRTDIITARNFNSASDTLYRRWVELPPGDDKRLVAEALYTRVERNKRTQSRWQEVAAAFQETSEPRP